MAKKNLRLFSNPVLCAPDPSAGAMSKQVLFANNAIKKHLKRLTPAQEYAWMNPNPPDQPHANLLQRLIPIAQIKYARLMLKKRETVWGHTPLVFRVRLYKASKEE